MTELNFLRPIDISYIVNILPSIYAGSLRIFGHWFGRPYDNRHHPVSALGLDSVLQIVFRGGERLIMWEPRGVLITETAFVVEKAQRVLWQWYHYGREPVPENIRELDYRVTDDQSLELVETGSTQRRVGWDTDVYAVELLGID